ncbi:hypothetical protein [Streptomyces sp. NPDC086787]|uniref:hypothetical protein n=1 Tax=Streptomyces sp. NPDC086787 TaxID=3365759 RepID=UPI00381B308D
MSGGWVELEHEFSLDVQYNPVCWLELPPRWETAEWQDIGGWARDCAELFWRSHGQEPGESGVPFLADTLQRLADAFAPEAFDTRVVLRMWEPLTMPLPVVAAVKPAQGGREETLRALIRADDPEAVEPPVVETFRAELLGEGLRAFRYVQQDDASEVLAGLRYAWRDAEAGADVVLWTATDDTSQIIRAAKDIEELTHKVSVAVWELEPDGGASPDTAP